MKLISTKKAHAMIMDLPLSCSFSISDFNSQWFTPTINALADKLKNRKMPTKRHTRSYYSPSDKCYCTVGYLHKAIVNGKLDPNFVHVNLNNTIKPSNIPSGDSISIFRLIANINDNLPTDKYSIRDIIEFMYWLANSMDNVAVNYRNRITLPGLKQMVKERN